MADAGIARAAAREGATVAVSGRRREPGDALVAELRAAGTKALFVEADMGEVAQARAFAAAAIAEFGRVDGLVNAAGPTSRGTLLDTTPELFDAHIAVNLKAPFFGLNIGWTDTEGEDVTQRRFHGAGDDWRAKVGASLPMGKLGQVGEIAEFVVFLLSDRSGVVTGSVIDWDQNVLGGMD